MATFDLATRWCFIVGVSAETDGRGAAVIGPRCSLGSSNIVKESGISDDSVAYIVSSGSCGLVCVEDIGDSGLSKESDESVDVSGGICVGCSAACVKDSGDSSGRTDSFD
jgi:hypothetical protein